MRGYDKPTKTVTTRTELIVGLDLGQSRDFSAWIVVERTKVNDQPATYACRHIDRIRDQAYPQIVHHTAALVKALRGPEPIGDPPRYVPPPRPTVSLVIDFTGVGRAVADLITELDLDCHVCLVTITGGDATTRGERGDFRVPKRLLASTIDAGLQSSRLTIEKQLALAEILTKELKDFRVKTTLTGHQRFEAGESWREGAHDDLVLSLSLACWWGEHRPGSWDDLDAAALAGWRAFSTRRI